MPEPLPTTAMGSRGTMLTEGGRLATTVIRTGCEIAVPAWGSVTPAVSA